jgi:hypothetical protein
MANAFGWHRGWAWLLHCRKCPPWSGSRPAAAHRCPPRCAVASDDLFPAS